MLTTAAMAMATTDSSLRLELTVFDAAAAFLQRANRQRARWRQAFQLQHSFALFSKTKHKKRSKLAH